MADVRASGWSRLAFWMLAPLMVTAIVSTLGVRWLPFAVPVWLVGGIPWWRLRQHARGDAELTVAEPLVTALLGLVSAATVPALVLAEPRLRAVAAVLASFVFVVPGLIAVVAAVPLFEATRRRAAPAGSR